MEPLQVIAFVSGMGAQRRLLDSLPDAPQVAYTGREVTGRRTGSAVRARVARMLRDTADRIDPCPTPTAG